MNRVKITFFCRKISTVDRRGPKDPGAPRGTPVHPGRAPAGPRFIPALTRFTPVLGPVHPGPCRQNPGDTTVLPGSPRRSYGPSRFTTVHPGEVKMHPSRWTTVQPPVLPGSPRSMDRGEPGSTGSPVGLGHYAHL